jgi:hypothetical protein
VRSNHIRTLPPSLAAWTRLASLDLRDNPLARLPDQLGACTALATLDARGCPLTSIDAAVGTLPQLARLRCGWADVRDAGPGPGAEGQWPPEGLEGLQRLRAREAELDGLDGQAEQAGLDEHAGRRPSKGGKDGSIAEVPALPPLSRA